MQKPARKNKDSHYSNHPDEIAKDWSKKKVQIPRFPFFFINMYQFCMPILPPIGIDALFAWLYVLFSISMVIQIILLPVLFLLNYWIYIWSMSKFCKLLNYYYDKKSPPKAGIYARDFSGGNVADIAVHYYHLRGFLYKWPMFITKKSIFPWMINFVLGDMSNNKVDKDAMYGDSFPCLEFSTLKAGSVVMEGSAVSSHTVDSIFGKLTITPVSMEENAVLNTNSVMIPGSNIGKNMAVGPLSMMIKNMVAKSEDSDFFWGVPTKKKLKGCLLNQSEIHFNKNEKKQK